MIREKTRTTEIFLEDRYPMSFKQIYMYDEKLYIWQKQVGQKVNRLSFVYEYFRRRYHSSGIPYLSVAYAVFTTRSVKISESYYWQQTWPRITKQQTLGPDV